MRRGAVAHNCEPGEMARKMHGTALSVALDAAAQFCGLVSFSGGARVQNCVRAQKANVRCARSAFLPVARPAG